MDSIEFLLFQLENTLLTRFRNVYSTLLPGLTEDSIKVKFEAWLHTDPVPSDILQLFQWRNGFSYTPNLVIGKNQFCSWGYLLDLENGIRHANALAEVIDDKTSKYFPLITSLGGDYLLYKFEPGAEMGRIWLYSPALWITTPTLIYDTVSSLLETILDCYEKSAYSFDSANMLIVDDELERRIALRNNKKAAYWKEE